MASSRSVVGMLLLLLLLGASEAEQLVGMTHPAPSTLGLTAGFGSSLAGSTQYYISYGSLDANRAPCPAGTGRSYYTQNCKGSGAVQPYVRSCNAITRCQRGWDSCIASLSIGYAPWQAFFCFLALINLYISKNWCLTALDKACCMSHWW